MHTGSVIKTFLCQWVCSEFARKSETMYQVKRQDTIKQNNIVLFVKDTILSAKMK